LLDEDVHFTLAGYRDVRGRSPVVAAHDALLGAYVERSVITTRVLLTDSAQLVEWFMTGLYGDIRRPMAISGATVLFTKDDGSIWDIHLYFDEALVKAQIGMGPRGFPSAIFPATPKDARKTVEQTGSPEEKANLAPVHEALDALENGDEAPYLATMTDDVELTTVEIAEPARGRASARRYFRAMRKAIANLDTQIDNIWAIGQFVVVEYHIVGEQRGPIAWVPAQKDNLLKLFVVDVMQLQDSKIARVWRYDNPAQIASSSEGGTQ
jgi:ketosteroid isomerase-like protein